MSADGTTAARVAAVRWFRDFEILPGLRTRTEHGLREEDRLAHFGIPDDLSGKRVLDVGCCDGYFSFLAEERGATVVAIDAWPHRGFFLAREIRGSRVAFRHASTYDLSPEAFGEFDLVFFFGVYYHLRNPLLALERIATVTRGEVLVESHVTDLDGSGGLAWSRFYEGDELAGDATNWWSPNLPALLQTVRAAGFPRATPVSTYGGNRAVVRAWKGPETASRAIDEEILLTIDPPLPSADGSSWIVSGHALSFPLPKTGVERVLVYLDELDEPAALVGAADVRLLRPELEPAYGPLYAECGYRLEIPRDRIPAGEHRIHVIAIGRRGWRTRSATIRT